MDVNKVRGEGAKLWAILSADSKKKKNSNDSGAQTIFEPWTHGKSYLMFT